MLDITSIIQDTKKDFTRDRASVISEFLSANTSAIVLSYIKKARGDAIKFYYLQDGRKTTCEYVTKNAKTLIKAFLKNNIKLYQYKNSKITPYNEDHDVK